MIEQDGRSMSSVFHWVLSRFYRRLADAHRHFGNSYGNRREHEAAVEDYSRAIVLDPAYAEAYYSRGILYWRELGNPGRAIRDLSQALELDSRRVEAYLNRGLAFKLRGDRDEAIADFQRYLTLGADPFWLEAAARQLAELRDDADTEDTAVVRSL
jgi:tetratricopeptide (TPR) repeat protein